METGLGVAVETFQPEAGPNLILACGVVGGVVGYIGGEDVLDAIGMAAGG